MGNLCGTTTEVATTTALSESILPTSCLSPFEVEQDVVVVDFCDRQFYKRLMEGLTVIVICDKEVGIDCTLRYQPAHARLVLSKDTLVRFIELGSIQRVMHEEEDLRRVQNCSWDALCCALLLNNERSITLRFSSLDEKKDFIEITNDVVKLCLSE